MKFEEFKVRVRGLEHRPDFYRDYKEAEIANLEERIERKRRMSTNPVYDREEKRFLLAKELAGLSVPKNGVLDFSDAESTGAETGNLNK